MKISQLKLISFRSFVDTELSFDAPRILITGLNGSGKSTIREAIKWVLTGTCQGLDGKRSGVELLAPDGNGKCAVSVEAVVEPVGLIAREYDGHGSGFGVKGWTGTASIQQAALYEKLHTTEPFFQAVLDSSVFLNLHHSDAKALVLGLLNVTVPIEGQSYSLDELDLAYRQAFRERTAAKAKAKAMVVPVKPDGKFPALDAIRARLKDLRDQVEGINRQAGKALGRRQALLDRKTRIPLALNEWDVDGLSAKIADLEERLAIMEAETDVAETMQPLAEPSEDSPDREAFLAKQRDRLQAHRPIGGCVLDSEVPCETYKLKFTNRAKILQAEIDALPARAKYHEVVKAQSALTIVRNELEALKIQQAKIEKVHENNVKHRQEIDEIDAELSSLPDISKHEVDLRDMKERIQKGETILAGAVAHGNAVASYAEAVQRASEAMGDVQGLETLCALLGPSGARVQALVEAMAPFQTAVNAFVGSFGWSVEFHVEPWEVIVNGRLVETWSRSEQYRIGIAIQLAIAQLSGLSFAIVDELDMLDHANREVVGRMLYQSDLDQILILSTREASVQLPAIPGMVCYRFGVTDGRTAVIERAEAASR